MRKFPVVMKQLRADDLRLTVRQELVDRLEDAISLGLTKIVKVNFAFT